MAVLVIAGSGRNAGKTAVGCALIQALPELQWTAVKVSPHRHENAGPTGEPDGDAQKDTRRYLAAGAAKALLLADLTDVTNGSSAEAAAALALAVGGHYGPNRGFLIESNRIDGSWVAADGERILELAVLAGPQVYWKPSLMGRAICADALILTGGYCCDELPDTLKRRRVFQLTPGRWISPELVEYVRQSLLKPMALSQPSNAESWAR